MYKKIFARSARANCKKLFLNECTKKFLRAQFQLTVVIYALFRNYSKNFFSRSLRSLDLSMYIKVIYPLFKIPDRFEINQVDTQYNNIQELRGLFTVLILNRFNMGQGGGQNLILNRFNIKKKRKIKFCLKIVKNKSKIFLRTTRANNLTK